jgi:hypothetical protein
MVIGAISVAAIDDFPGRVREAVPNRPTSPVLVNGPLDLIG